MDLFVSMPFTPAFSEVSRVVMDAAFERGLIPYRVDQDHLAEPIAQAIDRKIRESRVVVADTSLAVTPTSFMNSVKLSR